MLITGGTGFIGSHLARRLLEEGFDVVLLDYRVNKRRVADIIDRVKLVEGDAGQWHVVAGVVREHRPEVIWHLAAVLSAAAEARHPLDTFEANFMSTVNVMEAARIFDVEKVIFASSMASFGPGVPEVVPNDAPQRPITSYGISKVFGELWGMYYFRRYDLDFRALRFPSVVGPGRGPGGASAYSSLIIEKAALGEPYEVYVREDTRMLMIYVKDAVNAFLALYRAKDVRTRVYNVGGITPSAREIVDEVLKHVPDARITFRPDPDMIRIVESWPKALDDRLLREETGWELRYTLDKLVPDFIKEVRELKRLHGQP